MRSGDAEPLSHTEMGFLICGLLGPGPYDEHVLALKARLEAHEKERERLRDPCGHLCKTLAEKLPEVRFDDVTYFADCFRVRMSVDCPARYVAESSGAQAIFDLSNPIADQIERVRFMPARSLAEVIEIEKYALAEDEEPFVELLLYHARKLLSEVRG